MAYLAKRMFDHRQAASAGTAGANAPMPASTGTTTSSPTVLGDVLAAETRHAEQGGLLGAVLGGGGLGDLLKAGSSILGGTLSGNPGPSDRPSA
jgi:hypothetical protein